MSWWGLEQRALEHTQNLEFINQTFRLNLENHQLRESLQGWTEPAVFTIAFFCIFPTNPWTTTKCDGGLPR